MSYKAYRSEFTLHLVDGSCWCFIDEISDDGFLNSFLQERPTGQKRRQKRTFCLGLDHDSILDCIHIHGVPVNTLRTRKQALAFKPWEGETKQAEMWLLAYHIDRKTGADIKCPRCEGVIRFPA